MYMVNEYTYKELLFLESGHKRFNIEVHPNSKNNSSPSLRPKIWPKGMQSFKKEMVS